MTAILLFVEQQPALSAAGGFLPVAGMLHAALRIRAGRKARAEELRVEQARMLSWLCAEYLPATELTAPAPQVNALVA